MRQRKQNLDRFDGYVMNDIPIRLIRLSDMKFVGRGDVRKHFRSSVEHSYSYYPHEHVKYAILSHRWLDGGEPTYEEMKAGTASGPGYEKLKKFCEKAREYDTEFAWSDTCCIDKSSSTELDESIRSMFRWYENSTICIVHLAQSKTIEGILHDEWTRRVWTLQELLAPRNIKIFNKYWIPLTGHRNDKEDQESKVMETLETATGIPRCDLYSFSPHFLPQRLDERMAWAARRKATRVEDVAYSLMGIFDVSLQIAYGEGGDRAFRRLIDAIMQDGDPSILNWVGNHAPFSVSRAVPYSPESFVGSRNVMLDIFTQPLEMNMTSLGLRVSLVILPLSYHSHEEQGPLRLHVVLGCPLCPTIKVDINPLAHALEWQHLSQFEYALGIVNYSLFSERSRKVLGIRGKSVGLILYRNSCSSSSLSSLICNPRGTDFVGFKFASPPEETSRWELLHGVGLIEVEFPNIPSESLFFIDPEYLETVHL
ncbi:heterokaryon incompatibility protein-domain-containing protein [Suillus paluster]|uniref:heterokaryon incompatibility protein-domain-containing protein n=1 Tax=Suillus paluster TaxID=48578 RepID=UPI001B87826D|nr:heterokaryon incompatibility protein-domain-containing protein [Suillus paluster]KAG1725003.1 heterokaryon incompatibility protein-domain-containing protein [Suillus paluster]